MSITATQLQNFARSPSAFREHLLIDSDAGPVPLGSVLDDWQRADFSAMDNAWLRAAGHKIEQTGPSRAYLERPRGQSKTLDLAVAVLWALAFSPRQLSGVAAAADKTQAKLLRNSIDKMVRLNQWLGDVIDVQHSVVRNSRTGSALETLSSDVAASFGRTPDFIAVDEITHWVGSGLWESLISLAAKRSHCVVICIANA
ncbi:MAG: hypothetical protein KDA52_07745, partial [Planctomycetaceae bacterium]|nr:hypothetical protein [Planctomycetaceae bacterium]